MKCKLEDKKVNSLEPLKTTVKKNQHGDKDRRYVYGIMYRHTIIIYNVRNQFLTTESFRYYSKIY